MNIGEMQRKLSQWAERDKNHRFFDLYHLLYDKDWLQLAHDHVKENAGSKTAGCDGVNMGLWELPWMPQDIVVDESMNSDGHGLRRN